MKIQPPINNFQWRMVSQMFGVNKDTYSWLNIPGHNGIDIPGKYGEPILACHDGIVVDVSFDRSRSRGMGVVVQGDLGNFMIIQTTYWHLSEINVGLNQVVKTGQIIGKMGNTGFVFPEPNSMCPHCGTHLHFGVGLYKNGKPLFSEYKKYQDPVPFLFKEGDRLPVIFTKDLFLSKSDNEVSHLQTCLNLEGWAQDYIPIGYFGSKTQRDVKLLQQKNNLTPLLGFVGPKTRSILNKKYSQFYLP